MAAAHLLVEVVEPYDSVRSHAPVLDTHTLVFKHGLLVEEGHLNARLDAHAERGLDLQSSPSKTPVSSEEQRQIYATEGQWIYIVAPRTVLISPSLTIGWFPPWPVTPIDIA